MDEREGFGRAPVEVPIIEEYMSWRRLDPGAPLDDFFWFARQASGLDILDIVSEKEYALLRRATSDDPVCADFIMQGATSGP